jgi:hypothetical protein
MHCQFAMLRVITVCEAVEKEEEEKKRKEGEIQLFFSSPISMYVYMNYQSLYTRQ